MGISTPCIITGKAVSREVVQTIAVAPLGDGWDEARQPVDSQSTQSWKAEGDEWSQTGWDSKDTSMPTEVVVPFAEWEFSVLSTTANSKAYSLAYNVIRQSIYTYCQNILHGCNGIWDAVCDVNLEVGKMLKVFGSGCFGVQNMASHLRERLPHAITNLAHLRHRVAHPADLGEDNVTLQYVCQHISYARTMAKLLEDRLAVRKLDALLESLYEAAREQRLQVETYKTLEGLPASQEKWPMHSERLFAYVVRVRMPHLAYSTVPRTQDEWNAHRSALCEWHPRNERRNRVPPAIRDAALDWSTQYDFPGKMKPDYAA